MRALPLRSFDRRTTPNHRQPITFYVQASLAPAFDLHMDKRVFDLGAHQKAASAVFDCWYHVLSLVNSLEYHSQGLTNDNNKKITVVRRGWTPYLYLWKNG